MSEFLEKIREELFAQKETAYQAFMLKLLPTVASSEFLGVRMPYLKKRAKDLAKEKGSSVLPYGHKKFYEEKMLEALHIAFLPLPIEEKIFWIEKFLPQIDNWGICDSFSKALKLKNQEDKYRFLPFLLQCFYSEHSYTLRFAIVMFMLYYRNPEEISLALEIFSQIETDEYYVNIALAWAIAEYFSVCPEEVLPLLKKGSFPLWVHNKSIQKIKESKKVSTERKESLEKLKRKV